MMEIKKMLRIESDKYLIVEGGGQLGFRMQEDFRLNLDDVLLIGASGRVMLDDDTFYFHFVVRSGKIYSVNVYCVTEEFQDLLIANYKYNTDYFGRPESFYDNAVSEVIYPLEASGMKLFKKPADSFASFGNWFLRLFRVIFVAKHLLSDEVLEYLVNMKKKQKNVDRSIIVKR